jgi:threonyl-tRNA synthetase
VSVDAFAREAIAAGLRVRVNAEGSLGSRIREAASRRVPYAAVIGARDPDRVSLRPRGAEPLPPIPFREAIAEIAAAAKPA